MWRTSSNPFYAYRFLKINTHIIPQYAHGVWISETRQGEARQGGVCPPCGKKFALEEMHADHVTPWCKGGQTTLENGQMLCHDCNWTKGKK